MQRNFDLKMSTRRESANSLTTTAITKLYASHFTTVLQLYAFDALTPPDLRSTFEGSRGYRFINLLHQNDILTLPLQMIKASPCFGSKTSTLNTSYTRDNHHYPCCPHNKQWFCVSYYCLSIFSGSRPAAVSCGLSDRGLNFALVSCQPFEN